MSHEWMGYMIRMKYKENKANCHMLRALSLQPQTDLLINHQTNRQTNRPTDQLTDQPTDQPTDQRTNKQTNGPTDRRTDQHSGL